MRLSDNGIGVFFLVLAGVLAVELSLAESVPPEMGANRITAESLRKTVEYLASDELAGRANGTPGAAAAAAYIETGFRAAGLEPAVGDSFFHRYQVYTGVRVEGVIGMRDLARGYQFNKDYTPLGMSADGHMTTSLVFAGYGVTAPEYGYDDYAGVDVQGKIVIAFLGEPGMRDPESPFDGTASTSHSDLYRKAENARRHGAAGLLLTAGPLYATGADRVWRISQETGFRNAGIMVCQVSRETAAALTGPAGLDLARLQQQIDEGHEPRTVDLTETRLELKVALRRVETDLVNVVGKLPGSGEGSIVVLANFDGWGEGPDGSARRIHPGANANATGVAILLDIARTISFLPRTQKTVYFVGVSGYLLTSAGSEALVRDEILDSDEIACVLNLFALGNPAPEKLHVLGTGSAKGLGEVVRSVNSSMRAPNELRLDPEVARSGNHVPFAVAGVPTLTFFGGAFEQFGTPEDTVERIRFGDLVRIGRYLYGLSHTLANSDRTFERRPF